MFSLPFSLLLFLSTTFVHCTSSRAALQCPLCRSGIAWGSCARFSHFTLLLSAHHQCMACRMLLQIPSIEKPCSVCSLYTSLHLKYRSYNSLEVFHSANERCLKLLIFSSVLATKNSVVLCSSQRFIVPVYHWMVPSCRFSSLEDKANCVLIASRAGPHAKSLQSYLAAHLYISNQLRAHLTSVKESVTDICFHINTLSLNLDGHFLTHFMHFWAAILIVPLGFVKQSSFRIVYDRIASFFKGADDFKARNRTLISHASRVMGSNDDRGFDGAFSSHLSKDLHNNRYPTLSITLTYRTTLCRSFYHRKCPSRNLGI